MVWFLFITIFLFSDYKSINTISQTVSVIHNATLSTLNSNSSIIIGTCSECLCLMMINARPFAAFNCFHHNQTCEMFSSIIDQSSLVLTVDSSTSVYFSSVLSQNITSANAVSTSTTATVSISTVTSTTSPTSTTSIPSTTSITSPTSTTPTTSTTSVTTTTLSSSTTSVTTTSSITTGTTTTTTGMLATTRTTQSPVLGTISENATAQDTWISQSYLYTATSSIYVTLNFTFNIDSKCSWYLDDVSVKNSAQLGLLINGNFDQSSTLVGWTSGVSATCSLSYGLSATKKASGNYSFYHGCARQTAWVSQDFYEISGQVYNISFSYYLTCGNGNGTPDPVKMSAMID